MLSSMNVQKDLASPSEGITREISQCPSSNMRKVYLVLYALEVPTSLLHLTISSNTNLPPVYQSKKTIIR